MKKLFKLCIPILLSLLMANSVFAANCTGMVTIKELWPRQEGWIHVVAEGVTNMDISNCGNTGATGLLLNYNDSTGSLEGKKMLYSTLLAAFASGKLMRLCSARCDSQFPTYSSLTHIDGLAK